MEGHFQPQRIHIMDSILINEHVFEFFLTFISVISVLDNQNC